jgi:hypothetical protein
LKTCPEQGILKEQNMNNDKHNLQTCPFCMKAMDLGYIWLAAAQSAELRWQKDKPNLSAWKFWSMSRGEKLLKSNGRLFPKTIRRAYRCSECNTLIIEQITKEFTP